jgi:hypothetical protein
MSEGSAARFLREVRWSNGISCIYCGSLYVGDGIEVYTGGIGGPWKGLD